MFNRPFNSKKLHYEYGLTLMDGWMGEGVILSLLVSPQ